MKDIMEKMFSTMNERMNNPLISSFLISWTFINYKLFLVIFSSEELREKIHFIENDIFSSNCDKYFHIFFLPLTISLIYTFIYPYIDIAISMFSEMIKNLKARKILELERKHPIDRQLQKDYFENFDKELLDTKKILEKVYERETTNSTIASKTNIEIGARLKRQTLLLFCKETALTPKNVCFPLSQDLGSLSEHSNYNEMLLAYKTHSLFPSLIALSEFSESTEAEKNDKKFISLDDIIYTIKTPAAFMENGDYIEILLALGLITKVQNTDHFELITERLTTLKKLNNCATQ